LEAALTRKKLGTLLFLSGRNAEAEELLSTVRSTLERFAVSQPLRIDVRNELADAIASLAAVWATVGRREDAGNAFRRALELFHALAENDPQNNRYQKGLADCLRGLGTTSTLRGEYVKARSEMERAVHHRKAAALIRPTDQSSKLSLADDLLLLGEILDHANQPDHSEAVLKEATRLHGELASEFPNVADYAAAKAKDQYSLGNLYETLRRYHDAKEVLTRTATEYGRLRERYPDRADYRFQEAGLRYNLARILQNVNRSDDAEREIRAAVRLFEQFLKTSPDHNQGRAGLATSLHVLGNSLASLVSAQQHSVVPERLAEARRSLDRSIQTARNVLQTEPKNRVGLATLRGAHISLSEVLTLSGHYDEARECCMAIARLYENPGRGGFETLEAVDECLKIVKGSPGLNSLRRDEIVRAFVTLGNEYRRQALSLNSEDFDGAADLVVTLVFRLAYRLEPELRDLNASLSLARSLVARKPDSNTAWGALGIACYCSGQIQSAREALLKALALKNTEFEIYIFTAMCSWKSGDSDGARQFYQRAIGQWDEGLSTDDWACRLRAEAAALLGVADHPMPTGNREKTQREN
jgi:tetratricopeptide (TPR) repeat protein